MPWHDVDNLTDERIRPYREIAQRVNHEFDDLFIAEGRWIVERLIASRFEVVSCVVEQNTESIWRSIIPDTIEVFALSKSSIKQLVGYDFHRGIVACGRRSRRESLFEPHVKFESNPLPTDSTHSTQEATCSHQDVEPTNEHLAPQNQREIVVCCPRILDQTNLGSIIRSAAAFGVKGVIVGEGCTDPFSRRVIRVSAGNVFRIPIIQPSDIQIELQRCRVDDGFQLLATTPNASDSIQLEHFAPTDKMILTLGAEDYGLTNDWISSADQRLYIPMHGGTDSLNVATSAAIFLYALSRARV